MEKALKEILKSVKKATDRAEKNWTPSGPEAVIAAMKKSILSGNSPVKGQKRFDKYSDSYTDAINAGKYKNKKLRPVNMKLTGEMLKSLKWDKISGGFKIFFESDLAEIHSVKGAGKAKAIRKVIPTGNEKFKRSILKKALDILERIIQREFDKIGD